MASIIQYWHSLGDETQLAIALAVFGALLSVLLPGSWSWLRYSVGYVYAMIQGRRKEYAFNAQYLRWLVEETAYIVSAPSSLALDAHSRHAQPVLSSYLRVRVVSTTGDSARIQYSGLVERGSRSVVLGDPGAGKTTFIRFLAHAHALYRTCSVFQRKTRRLIASLPGFQHGCFPVYVRLDRWEEFSAKATDPSIANFILSSLPAPLRSKCPADFFESTIESGAALLLLDGLDEVTDYSARRNLAALISGESSTGSRKSTWIVTSRIVGYPGEEFDKHGFSVCRVEDLSLPQVRQFLRTAHPRIVAAKHGDVSPDALASQQVQQRVDSLISRIELNPGLRQLAVNPMMLSLISILDAEGIQLTGQRAQIYHDFVTLLLERWDALRGIKKARGEVLSVSDRLAILSSVSWSLQENKGSRDIEYGKFAQRLRAELVQQGVEIGSERIDQLIVDLEERCGLMMRRGVNSAGDKILAFTHLTFQEYLASKTLTGMRQEEVGSFLASNHNVSWWREPLLLLLSQRDDAYELLDTLAERAIEDGSAALLAFVCAAYSELSPNDQSSGLRESVSAAASVFSACKYDLRSILPLRADAHNSFLRTLSRWLSDMCSIAPAAVDYVYAEVLSGMHVEECGHKLIASINGRARIEEYEILALTVYLRKHTDAVVPAGILEKIPTSVALKHIQKLMCVLSKRRPAEAFSVDASNVRFSEFDRILACSHDAFVPQVDGDVGSWRGQMLMSMRERALDEERGLADAKALGKYGDWGAISNDYYEYNEFSSVEFYSALAGRDSDALDRLSGVHGLAWCGAQLSRTQLVTAYRETQLSFHKALCVLFLTQKERVPSAVASVLVSFLKHVFLADERGQSAGAPKYQQSLVLAAANRARNCLAEAKDGSEEYVSLLIACSTSESPEYREFAYTSASQLTSVSDSAISICKSYMASARSPQFPIAVRVLSKSSIPEEEYYNRAVALCQDSEREYMSMPYSAIGLECVIERACEKQ